MKSFKELTRKELAELDYEKLDAYTDVELVSKGIVKPLEVEINFPEYLKDGDIAPERDVTIYEVDGYTFKDMETATKVSQFIGSLPQVQTDYNYQVGSEFSFAKDVEYNTPQIKIKRVYSEPKFTANSEKLRQIKEARSKRSESKEQAVDAVIDYAVIDEVRGEMRAKVRDAIEFFAKAEKAASNYQQYKNITNNHEMALTTLFTVLNVQDDELKNEIRDIVAANTTATQEK